MKPTEYDTLHREISLPVVRVRAGTAGGSGTVIYSKPDEGGEHSTYVLTNHHVVDNMIKIEERWDPMLQRNAKRDVRGIPTCEFFEYRWQSRAVGASAVEADIEAYDKDEDLALLRLRSGRPPMAVAKLYPRDGEHELRVGMGVYCVGAGLGEPPVMTGGFLSQFGREIEHKEFWLNTAPAIFGNSGGALFLADSHEFIGVPARIAVIALGFSADAITHLQYAIPISRVYGFLEKQCYRFVYDVSFSEKGEEAERKRRLEADRLRLMSEEVREGAA